jgi:hypothetical protein
MSKFMTRLAAIVAVGVLAASVAVAAPDDKGKGKDKGKHAAAAKCPVCKMDLVSKKDKAHPTSVKVGDKTYYCCAKCPMGKKGDKKGK